jgi:hypothetical protein
MRSLRQHLELIESLLMGIGGLLPLENLTAQVGGPGSPVFTCTNHYIGGSLRVFVNGLLQTPGSGNSYQETGAASGEFTFEAGAIPSGADEVWVSYIPAP